MPTLLNLSPEAAALLTDEAKRSGRLKNAIVEDLILGKNRFPADIERKIAAMSKSLGISHSQAVERALVEYFSTVRKG